MKVMGISGGYHDAACAIVDDQKREIVFASHSERYSRVKNDKVVSKDMIFAAGHYDKTVFYERPFMKNTRRLVSGQGWKRSNYLCDEYIPHHWSHASAAYYTRPANFQEPVCVVIDAIGEWDTTSIWYKKKKVWSRKYPNSLGLFYSAATKAVGLKPNEDEYITMAMAANKPMVEKPDMYDRMKEALNGNNHRGFYKELTEDIESNTLIGARYAQVIIEEEIRKIMEIARKYSSYLCYGGGVALNCVANTEVVSKVFDADKIWIFPNPGDAGSAFGAACASIDKRIKWKDVYLGHNIKYGDISPYDIAKHIEKFSVCGLANGRAEFGPRALGNRSLLADPRIDISDTVNDIKRRQRFRPFAPAILEEHAAEYFDGPMNEYMQFTARAKHDYDSVTHIDGSARVQIVKKDSASMLRPVLEEFYHLTGCPMLLNTSLNIKGQPIVNTVTDALDFERKYNVRVF